MLARLTGCQPNWLAAAEAENPFTLSPLTSGSVSPKRYLIFLYSAAFKFRRIPLILGVKLNIKHSFLSWRHSKWDGLQSGDWNQKSNLCLGGTQTKSRGKKIRNQYGVKNQIIESLCGCDMKIDCCCDSRQQRDKRRILVSFPIRQTTGLYWLLQFAINRVKSQEYDGAERNSHIASGWILNVSTKSVLSDQNGLEMRCITLSVKNVLCSL